MSFLIDPIVHLKPYTEKEFVEIAVKVLDREEDIEKGWYYIYRWISI